MKNQKLVIAGAAFLILGGVATKILVDRRGEEAADLASDNMPSLPDIALSEVTELSVTTPGEDGASPTTVRLVKGASGWQMTAPVAGPADEAAVNAALEKLVGLEFAGIAASREQSHEQLGVTAAKAIRVEVKKGDETILTLLVGAFRGNNTMVRLSGDDARVFAARGSLQYAFQKDVKDWRNKTILSEDGADAKWIEFVNSNGTFAFAKTDAGTWEPRAAGTTPVANTPVTIANFDASKVESLLSSIADLRAVDFAAADATEQTTGLAAGARVTIHFATEGEGGVAGPDRVVTVTIGNKRSDGSDYFLRRSDNDTIFLVSDYLGDRLRPNLAAFERSAEPPPAPPSEAPPEPMGQGQIPPELMEQLQQQLRQQGGM